MPENVSIRSLRDLIVAYQTDKDSSYHKLRYWVRSNHDGLLNRLISDHGRVLLSDIKARLLLAWHNDWTDGGRKLAIGHSFIAQLRTLTSFGATILEDAECERLCSVLSKMRFPSSKPRVSHITAEHAIAIRHIAHSYCWPSIALAQAFQFELILRQKDVIGEWIPLSEPGLSDTVGPKGKWMCGLLWEEIDEHLMLRHVTSKRGKLLEADLSLAPMVVEEIELYGDHEPTGPVIICDTTGLPWVTSEFRRKWRICAEAAGVPKNVFNMDSRAGGITEASDAGADLEHIRQAATHSNISMTQKYNRGAAGKIAGVMQKRVAHRNSRADQ